MEVQYSILLVFLVAAFGTNEAWGSDKVKLTDVKALTLHHGSKTTGRRSQPVPQLQCMGGTAGCSDFEPQVVQCSNKGTDGYDVQWECKTDMDNAYRFGKIAVTCEGYAYPDDPYILKGSCGLEYNIDFTEEGMKQNGYRYSYITGTAEKSDVSWFGDIILVAIVLLLIIAIVTMCNRSEAQGTTHASFGQPSQGFAGTQPPPPPGFNSGFAGTQPPPPAGFRSNLGTGYDSGCGESTMGGGYSGTNNAAGSRGSSFWPGAMIGSLFGYMFGSNRNRGHTSYSQPTYTRPSSQSNSFWTSSSGSTSTGSTTRRGSGGSFFSSGSRKSSGFGGTKRR